MPLSEVLFVVFETSDSSKIHYEKGLSTEVPFRSRFVTSAFMYRAAAIDRICVDVSTALWSAQAAAKRAVSIASTGFLSAQAHASPMLSSLEV